MNPPSFLHHSSNSAPSRVALAMILALLCAGTSPANNQAIPVNNPQNGQGQPANNVVVTPQPGSVSNQPSPTSPSTVIPVQTRIQQPMLPFTALLDPRPPARLIDLRKLPELTLVPPLKRE